MTTFYSGKKRKKCRQENSAALMNWPFNLSSEESSRNRKNWKRTLLAMPGLPDGIFSNQKS
jgi:hypothetical protein